MKGQSSPEFFKIEEDFQKYGKKEKAMYLLQNLERFGASSRIYSLRINLASSPHTFGGSSLEMIAELYTDPTVKIQFLVEVFLMLTVEIEGF